MIRLGVCGIRGRMGRAVVDLARDMPDLHVTVGVDRERNGGVEDIAGVGRVGTTADIDELLHDVDVVIDFSTAAGTRTLLERAAPTFEGRALVVGSTGLDAHALQLLDDVARSAAVLTAANFSVGVNVLLALCERLGTRLSADAFDVEVVEAHHRRKIDAPSGTALALAGAVATGRGAGLDALRRDGRTGETGVRPAGEIGMHAVRGGGVPGEHRVLFLGARETIELRHEALDRSLFAEGALTAARWIKGRAPGRYTMRDVLDI